MNRYDWLDAYLLAKPGVEKDFKAEWQWFRYMVGGKLFAAVCEPGTEYPKYQGRELINLKCDPIFAETLRGQYADVLPGFYMDKRCWIAVYLDGAVPEDVFRGLCDMSYRLVFEKLTKKAQREILGAD